MYILYVYKNKVYSIQMYTVYVQMISGSQVDNSAGFVPNWRPVELWANPLVHPTVPTTSFGQARKLHHFAPGGFLLRSYFSMLAAFSVPESD